LKKMLEKKNWPLAAIKKTAEAVQTTDKASF
jgi:hypothetical protein